MTDVVKGLTVGFIAGVCVFYAFQTRVVYPYWVTGIWDNPWILVLVALAALGLASWSAEVAVLLLLCVVALIVDNIVFARKPIVDKVESKAWSSRVNRPPPAIHDEIDDDTRYGVPVAAPTLANRPEYPVFYGIDQPQSGPAPF
jgi:hypothetical protein